jgi:cysteinyl-tRNA synthetase
MFCLNALYRAKLNFTWDGLNGAAVSLNRLRNTVYDWGEPDAIDDDYRQKFLETVNDDLNMPRTMALTWELVKSNLPDATKKATILYMDQVLGLGLAEWRPTEETIPEEIITLVQQRQQARQEKRWKDADAIREQVTQAGFEIEDTPQGPRLRKKKQKVM